MAIDRESSLVNFRALKDAPEQRAELLRNVTALLAMVADTCQCSLLDTYDSVLIRLTDMSDAAVRAEVARRLADLRRAPAGVVRKLALDDIVIAQPLLIRSAVLTEHDLVGIAQLRGNQHRRAIAARPDIGAALTWTLISRGDDSVRRAAAANATASYSRDGYDRLMAQARSDREMQLLIAAHPATPVPLLRQLAEFAGAEATDALRHRPQPAPARPAEAPPRRPAGLGVYDFDTAARRVEEWLDDTGSLDIAAVAGFAARDRFAEAVVGLVRLSGFDLDEVLSWFAERDTRTVLLVVRALGGSERDFAQFLNAGPWRLRLGADRRAEALRQFQDLGIDRAKALLEEEQASRAA